VYPFRGIDRRAARRQRWPMRLLMAALGLLAWMAAPHGNSRAAGAVEPIVVVQEARTAEKGKKTIQHLAVLKNAGDRSVHGLRVTIELYDFFGKLLWAGTATPTPASLRPGDTATLSLPTPDLPAHRRTAYRFDYRAR